MKTVKQWLEFLKEDSDVRCVNMELIDGLPSRRKWDKTPVQVLTDWDGWLEDKVAFVDRYCDNSGYILHTISAN